MADIIPLLIFLTVILLFALIITYNSFIKYRNMIEEEWSGIDTALKRRTNLIPNLISAVKGYSKYEADTLAEMTRTRGHAEDVEGRSNEESQISKSLGGLIAVAEAYPDLKASENFSVLQQALIEVEQEIQQLRRDYNRAVRKYNTGIQSFPGNIMARLFHFTKAEYFSLELATQREVPDVDFG